MASFKIRWGVLLALVTLLLAACASEAADSTPSESQTEDTQESEPADEDSAPSADESEEEQPSDEETSASGEEEEDAVSENEEEVAVEPEEPAVERPDYDPAALEVVAELNQWRLSIGLWPFQPNDDLTQIAEEHADYLMTLPAIPSGPEIHIGSSAEGPKDRARAVGWPHYNNEEQIAITEIAALNFDAQASVGWWMGSKVHHDSVVNPAYRELGAAAREHPFGMLYIVVLGARPDTLPALVDPLNAQLYLSSEQYEWSPGGDWIHDLSEIQLLPTPDDAPEDGGWIPYQTFLDAPESEEQAFGVALSDGERELTVGVNPLLDIAWLPDNLTLNGPTADADAQAAEEAAAEAEAAAQEGAQITVVYDEVTLLLINSSSEPVDLTNLQFVSGDLTVPATLWDTDYLSAPLSEFPAGDCLQVYDWNTSDPGISGDCGFRHSIVYVRPDEIFWATDDFQLRYDGEYLTTCELGAEQCQTDLP